MKHTIKILALSLLTSCGQTQSEQPAAPIPDTTAIKPQQNFTEVQPTSFTETEIDKYEAHIKQLKKEGKLEKIGHRDMTAWGTLTGYYLDQKLVLMEAFMGAENRAGTRHYYINQDTFVKVTFQQDLREDNEGSLILTTPVIVKMKEGNKITKIDAPQELITKNVKDGYSMRKYLEDLKNKNK
jgi:hypothetical protein